MYLVRSIVSTTSSSTIVATSTTVVLVATHSATLLDYHIPHIVHDSNVLRHYKL
jgi:hypothetical protein